MQEHRENTRITTPVKCFCEAPTDGIAAQPIQEMQPTVQLNQVDDYGPFLILKEMPKFFVGGDTP